MDGAGAVSAVAAQSGEPRQLACQQSPLALEHLDEIVGDRPYARYLCKISADEKPHIALRQTPSQRHLHEVRLMSRHDVSWKKRNAITGASRCSLGRLAVGAK
jgi:hypothetical protein